MSVLLLLVSIKYIQYSLPVAKSCAKTGQVSHGGEKGQDGYLF